MKKGKVQENFFTKKVKIALGIFIAINILLYLFIYLFNDKVPFNEFNYSYNFHHFTVDSRINGGEFNLINSLAQADAQWYLKIADKGYPTNPKLESDQKDINSGLAYAFFPMYPFTIGAVDLLINNIEVSAFVFANIMLIVNYLSLIYVIKKLISEDVGIKTAFLLFLFPFSIFYRSYFTEGLFLFFLIWFSHYFLQKKYLESGLLLGLLNITRGTGILLLLPYFYFIYKDYQTKEVSLLKSITSLMLIVAPAALWGLFNFIKTGEFLYFMQVRSSWFGGHNFIEQFINNINTLSSPLSQSFHSFHSSQVDLFIIYLGIILLFLSIGRISAKLWLISLCLFITPLLFNDTMSFSRMQIVSFPLFLFIANELKNKSYIIAAVFGALLFLISLYFVNWHWVG